jgi:sterol 3beta-glucosyltransferase
MRTVIATYGTTGDIQPLLGLARELRRRRHAIKFAAPPDFAQRIKDVGFDFVPLGTPMDPRELREVYGRASLSGDVVDHVRRTLPLVIRDGPRMVDELANACVGADVLIALPYQLAGRIVHEQQGIPLVSVHLSPFGGYSRRFAAESARLINELRGCYGLSSLTDPLGIDGSSHLLALYAVSPELFLRPRHWPSHHRMTGFFFFDEKWLPDPALSEFMEAGDSPVVISFGSVLHDSPEPLAQTVLGAIKRVGRRALVQRGWTGLQFNALPEGVMVVDFVPHHWLFPRAGCVVHAGGAGTIAASLRAGVPSVVVPHVLDQFIWGNLIKERGCAPEVIPFTKLTSECLGAAIEQALRPAYRKEPVAMAERLSQENGVCCATDLIESCLC